MNNFLLGLFIFAGLFCIGIGIKIGLMRSAAISSGMTPQEYITWVEGIKELR